jgi:hypothetical protein
MRGQKETKGVPASGRRRMNALGRRRQRHGSSGGRSCGRRRRAGDQVREGDDVWATTIVCGGGAAVDN